MFSFLVDSVYEIFFGIMGGFFKLKTMGELKIGIIYYIEYIEIRRSYNNRFFEKPIKRQAGHITFLAVYS